MNLLFMICLSSSFNIYDHQCIKVYHKNNMYLELLNFIIKFLLIKK